MSEHLVYNVTYAPRYRDAVKIKLTVSDFLDYPSISTILTAVEAQAKKDIKPAVTPSGGSGASSSTTEIPAPPSDVKNESDKAGPDSPTQTRWNSLSDDQIMFGINSL